jgi:small conductance mechanosensitive channel
MQRFLLGLLFSLALILGPCGDAIAAGESSDAVPPKPVTTADSAIPVEELDLILKPLTKSQLLIELEAWQALVQKKAQQISMVEIMVKRLNKEIEKGDQRTKLDQNTGAMEDKGKSSESIRTPLRMPKEEIEEKKVKMLEDVAKLHKDRTVLLDQLKAVIAALETKTDKNDTETLAIIRDYTLYASAVSGIQVDIKDATSTWLVIRTWLLSEEGGQRWGFNILSFIGLLIAAWVISSIFSRLIHHAMQRVPGTSKLLEDFFVKMTRWLVMAIGIIMALSALEVSIGPLLAVVGATGFAIAFALQDSLSNFANGLMILFFRPFDVGHFIEAGGVIGKVESLNLVSTTIKTFDNRVMVVPNNKVWRDVITNSSAVETRRVDMEFGIGYDDDIDKAQTILEEIVTAHPKVLEKPAPKIRVNTLGASSVDFIVRPWTKRADRMSVYWDITREVKKRFDAEGISIPYPQQAVHLHLNDTDKKALLAKMATDS